MIFCLNDGCKHKINKCGQVVIETNVIGLNVEIDSEDFYMAFSEIEITKIKLTEIIARNLMAWETSKDKKLGLLPESYLSLQWLFELLTGKASNWTNLKEYAHLED